MTLILVFICIILWLFAGRCVKEEDDILITIAAVGLFLFLLIH